jgi:putative DNA primase/helicase
MCANRSFFVLWGTGSNGKSTEINAIRAALATITAGPSLLRRYWSAISPTPSPTTIARLRGARLVTASESDAGRKLAEGLVKQLTGGDPVMARFLRHEFFSFSRRTSCSWPQPQAGDPRHRPTPSGVASG